MSSICKILLLASSFFLMFQADSASAEQSPSIPEGESFTLFKDLKMVENIDKELKEELPLFYNYSLIGGYFTMPSGRMASAGMFAFGAGRLPPYNIYGVNFQPFDRVELSGNYRVYTGVTEQNFGKEGFGDDAERIGNIKVGIIIPSDDFFTLTNFVFGTDDFVGTKRFTSQYVALTRQWLSWNLETTLGWGRGRIKGFFGGAAWTPLRNCKIEWLKNIAILAEYDANNYKWHAHEHPEGRKVKSRVNGGLSYLLFDTLQLQVNSVRGEKIAAGASIRYPLGLTKGFFPKIDDPLIYKTPIDTEPLGLIRPQHDFAQELAYAFSDQGLDLYTLFLTYDHDQKKTLWLKVVNNRYREEKVVRDRIQHILAALTPSDIKAVTVVVEADALPCNAYHFRTEDLQNYRLGTISDFELKTLSPMIEATRAPSEYDSALLFRRKKSIWTFTARPRLLTFFGSTKGKFKYNLSAIAYPEGYILDQLYYKIQAAYNIVSSMADLGSTDRLNPSKLPNVRTDTLKYLQTNTVSLEKAFIQKDWNLGKGVFCRLATGYFEVAYGGVASEILYYPVHSNWAVGIEAATVLKRRYHGVAFTRRIREAKDHKVKMVPFVGVQYFLDLFYDFRPLNLDFKVMAGQFLAKDLGVRTEMARYFPSGLRMSIWYTFTNAHDKVNGRTYYDKGFSLSMPLDMFLRQSSRNYIGYGMSAWLRDCGAIAETGKQLYDTLFEERVNVSDKTLYKGL